MGRILSNEAKVLEIIVMFLDQGDYKCDAPDGEIPEQHIAAWDHPSMDYINKDDENIIFTLCQVRSGHEGQVY